MKSHRQYIQIGTTSSLDALVQNYLIQEGNILTFYDNGITLQGVIRETRNKSWIERNNIFYHSVPSFLESIGDKRSFIRPWIDDTYIGSSQYRDLLKRLGSEYKIQSLPRSTFINSDSSLSLVWDIRNIGTQNLPGDTLIRGITRRCPDVYLGPLSVDETSTILINVDEDVYKSSHTLKWNIQSSVSIQGDLPVYTNRSDRRNTYVS